MQLGRRMTRYLGVLFKGNGATTTGAITLDCLKDLWQQTFRAYRGLATTPTACTSAMVTYHCSL